MRGKTLLVILVLGLTGPAAVGEERVIVTLPFDQYGPYGRTPFETSGEYGRRVCSITLRDVDETTRQYLKERPGDDVVEWVNRFTHRLIKASVCAKVGSELRLMGTADFFGTTVTPEGNERLCFRKTKKGWAYLCGRGSIKYPATSWREERGMGRLVEYLGRERTLESCLAALDSSDEIIREGCARDLARLATQADLERVSVRLSRLLADPVPEVRRGAAEAIGRLAYPGSLVTLKAARDAEKDELTKEYIDEALALLGAAALCRESRDAGIPAAEAAKLYNAGVDAWVEDMLFGMRDSAEGVLRERFNSKDSEERLAAVRLVRAVKPTWAQAALAEIAENDPDLRIKVAAKLALEDLRESPAKAGPDFSLEPVVQLSPPSLEFGATLVGTSSTPQPVTLRNTGGGALNLSSIAASGDFSQSNNCSGSLASRTSCIITVVFTPTGKGVRSGAITITDNATGSPQQVRLDGIGKASPDF